MIRIAGGLDMYLLQSLSLVYFGSSSVFFLSVGVGDINKPTTLKGLEALGKQSHTLGTQEVVFELRRPACC